MSSHECERCGRTSSVFWHRLGYGCTDEGDHAYKVVEFCDWCLYDLVQFMEEKKVKSTIKEVDE